MPKMKTHRGAAKRFKRTGSGKIIHKKAGMSHIMGTKSRKRKRRLNIPGQITGGGAKKVDRLMPK